MWNRFIKRDLFCWWKKIIVIHCPLFFFSLSFWFFLPYQIYFFKRICGIGVSERLPLIAKEFVVASHFPFFSSFSIWFFLPYQIFFASRAIFCCDSLYDTRHFEYNLLILQQWNSNIFTWIGTFRRGPLCWCKNLVLDTFSSTILNFLIFLLSSTSSTKSTVFLGPCVASSDSWGARKHSECWCSMF